MTFQSSPRNADNVFSEFFGTSSPYGGFASSSAGGRKGTERQMKEAAIERTLPCSLEELYKGTTKKMKISRDIVHVSGKILPIEETLTIEIKPGWKKGTKITFPEKGSERLNVTPADLVFIVDEKPHSLFTRDGNDLIATLKISLGEALTGYTARVATLDGRTLTVPINSIIHPEYEEVVPGEGMPFPKDPSRKGNLRIKFNTKFPDWLSVEQKAVFRHL